MFNHCLVEDFVSVVKIMKQNHKSKVREGWEEREGWRVRPDKTAEWEALKEACSEEAAAFDTAESMEKWAASLVPQVTIYD